MGILPKKPLAKIVPEEVKEAPKQQQPQILVNLDNPLAPPTVSSSNFDLSDGFQQLDLNVNENNPLEAQPYQYQDDQGYYQQQQQFYQYANEEEQMFQNNEF